MDMAVPTSLLRWLPLLALPVALTACQNREADTLKQQNAQLQAQVQQLQTQLSEARQAAQRGAGSGELNALKAELAWRQAQGYSANVHAAYLGRMAEDPMYTPERLAKEVPDCTRADEVGDRDFGKRPESVTTCTVEADGDNDVRVTVKAGERTFVNGVEGGL